MNPSATEKFSSAFSNARSLGASITGSALLWTWGFAWALNPSLAPTSASPTAQAYLASMFAYIAAAAFVFFRFTCGKVSYSKRSISCMTFLVTVATTFEAALPFAPLPSFAKSLAPIAIGAANGVGLLYLSIAWGARYSLLSKHASMVIEASFFITFVLNILLAFLPYPVNAILIAALPPVAMFLWSSHTLSADQGKETGRSAELRQRETTSDAVIDGEQSPSILPWRTISVLSIVPFLASFFSTVRSGEAQGSPVLSFAVAGCLCLAYLVVLVASRKQTNVKGSYLLLIPVATLALSLMMIDSESYSGLSETLLRGSAYLLHVVIWVQLAQVSIKEGLAPLVAFGIGGLLVSALQLAGSLTGIAVAAYGIGETHVPAFAMISLLVLVTSLAILFYGKSSEQEKASASSQGRVFPNAKTDGECTPDGPNSSDELLGIAETKLDVRINNFAEKYGLSSRESEVLGYFVRGRNIPYIAEQLSITTGTVKTHSSHIFQKANVTSRQQLLDLFESLAD